MDELKTMLKRLVWDYNIPENELVEIFLHDKKGHSMTRPDMEARMLGYYNWHHIIRVIGYKRAFEMLNDEVIKRIFPKSYQERLYGLRNILSEKSLPAAG